jgi:hypothetical protein
MSRAAGSARATDLSPRTCATTDALNPKESTMPPTPAAGATAEGQGQPAEGEPLDELEAALGEEPAEGDGAQSAEEWTPPTREEWAAAQAALEAERAKLKRARTQAQKLRESSRKGDAPAQPAGDGQEGGAPAGPDPQLAVWQARAVRASAKAGLLDRGADPEMVDLALARLKPDEIDFTDDDEPDLDAWLDDVQDRYPKLFAKAEPQQAAARRPPGAVDQGSAKGRPVQRQMSYGERVIANAQAAMRGAGRRTP